MALAELARGHSGAFAKLLRERTLIAKAVIQSDVDDRCGGPCQGLRSSLHATAQQQFVGAQAQSRPQFAMQVPL